MLGTDYNADGILYSYFNGRFMICALCKDFVHKTAIKFHSFSHNKGQHNIVERSIEGAKENSTEKERKIMAEEQKETVERQSNDLEAESLFAIWQKNSPTKPNKLDIVRKKPKCEKLTNSLTQASICNGVFIRLSRVTHRAFYIRNLKYFRNWKKFIKFSHSFS